jgi:hypothetical protein
MAQGLPRRNLEKNAVGTESIRSFLRISTQNHGSFEHGGSQASAKKATLKHGLIV